MKFIPSIYIFLIDNISTIFDDTNLQSDKQTRTNTGRKTTFMENFTKSRNAGDMLGNKKPKIIEQQSEDWSRYTQHDFEVKIGFKMMNQLNMNNIHSIMKGKKLVTLRNIYDIIKKNINSIFNLKNFVILAVVGMVLRDKMKEKVGLKLCDEDQFTISILYDEKVFSSMEIKFGSVFIISEPTFLLSEDKKSVLLIINSPNQINNIGISSDHGICQRSSGNMRCPNVINKTKNTLCYHHIMQELKSQQSNRMALNSSSNYNPLLLEEKEKKESIHNITVGKFEYRDISYHFSAYKAEILSSKKHLPTQRTIELSNPQVESLLSSPSAGSRNLRKHLGIDNSIDMTIEDIISKNRDPLMKKLDGSGVLHPNSKHLHDLKKDDDEIIEIEIEEDEVSPISSSSSSIDLQKFKQFQKEFLVEKKLDDTPGNIAFKCIECNSTTTKICGIIGHHIIIVNKADIY